MTRSPIDPGGNPGSDPRTELQRTREQLRLLLASDVEEVKATGVFPRSMTMRLLLDGVSHRLAWGAAGGALRKVPTVTRMLARALPVTTLLGMLLKRKRN